MNPLSLTPTQTTTPSTWQDRVLAVASRRADVATSHVTPSVIVSSVAPVADATYASAVGVAVDPSSDDAISALLTRNASSSTNAFTGLGQALLGRFATDGANFSSDITGTTSADASISLAVRTASGATVKLSLNAHDGSLSVSLNSDRTLSDTERNALAGLAQGFQTAVDGLNANPPTLSLDGLMAADPTVLQSVDVNATVTTAPGVHETIAVHTGSDARSLSVDGAAGHLALNLDMSQPATWGSRAQRDASVAHVIDQADAAARRGQGNAALVSLFKDGFTQLNSHYPATPAAANTRGTVRDLSTTDHALLTGLADFQASISQAANASNPMRSDERDTFNYDLSQSTSLGGRNALDRRVTQTQDSHLKASFHSSPWPDAPLNLTTKLGSQNYKYTTIDETAHASTTLGYAKGKLVAASVSHSASQDTHVLKYMVGQLVDETDTPSHHEATRDLLSLLTDATRHPGSAAKQASTLDTLHASVGLMADPARV